MSNPLFIKSASIEIDGTEYGDLISNVLLTPTTPILTFKGISGKTFQSVGKASYTLQFDYTQDWTSTDSLALKLLNDAGENVFVTIHPEAGTGTPGFTVEVTLLEGSFGGAVDTVASASVTLPVTGKPEFIAAVVTP